MKHTFAKSVTALDYLHQHCANYFVYFTPNDFDLLPFSLLYSYYLFIYFLGHGLTN